MRGKHQIEDLYPLSPVQHGILFHCLYAPDSSLYFVQKTCALRGRLNVPAFERAWQRVIDRHAALRTAFVWEGLDEPVQVVHARVELLLHKLDWRRLPAGEQRERLDAYLETERKQGFDLTAAPLMRLALIRLSDDSYQFVWSYHHLLLDGWCNALILGEVFTFYEAFSQGRETEPKRSRPFRDYIAWLQEQDLSKAEGFWREALRGLTAPTPLRVDQLAEPGRAPEQAFGEERAALTLNVTHALQALARQHRLTMHTLVQGAWGLLLHRYSGEADVLFGEVVSGRPAELAGVETMVGLFINTLPVRVRVTPEARLIPWLKDLQEQQVNLRQYEHSPLVQVQRWSEIPAGTPLFDTLLAYENYPADASLQGRGGDLRIESYASAQAANYPLTVTAAPMPELTLHIKYDCARFEVGTIRRMLGHLTTLLEAVAASPERRLADLPVLTQGERARMLVEWNETAADYPRHQLITELFESQAERTPEAVALAFREERLTYRELNRRADLLASYLRASGVGPEVLVGVCAGRTAELVVALLGVLKAGGAYVPLDPSYPAERLAFILADAQVKVLLTQERLAEGLPPHDARVIRLDADWPLVERAGAGRARPVATDDNLAYVIYTSGSTGQPKGVAIAHSSAVTLIHWARQHFDAEELSGVLFGTSIIFDLSVFELFVTLGAGGTVILAENALELPRLPAAAEVRLVNTVPSAMTELLRTGGVPETVRTVNLAGEPLARKLVQQVYERTSAARVLNLYGPSEDTTYSTFDVVECDERRGVTIGRPIANTQVYLLDAHMQPVPVGVTGELYLGGEGLARGYLRRPGLTAERFIPDPFSAGPGARLYRTGDLARYLPDGRIDFLGRADHQVKIRGFRIELGEVEAALNAHPSVRQSVAALREDVSGDRRLVAYVVGDGAPAAADLRSFLKQRLPDYMIPACFVLLDQMPLTPNGKVDRKALPAPDLQRPELSNYEPPRTPTQELLAGLWEDLLGVERVGLSDNFFDLGGHSLLAIRLTSRLGHALGLDLPLRSVFEAPTLADLAAAAESALAAAGGGGVAPPIERADRTQPLPLSFAQQRLWFLAQLEPDSPSYNIPAAVRLRGQLDVGALERSLDEVVRRHEALRTGFASFDGSPVQVIAERVSLRLVTEDLTHLPEGAREAEVSRHASAEAARPFDLRGGPLLRAALLKLGDEEHVLLLTTHHIVSDGWSMGVLVREMGALYGAFSRGEVSPLPELPIQYADYAAWQREWLGGERLERQLAFWRGHLRGAPPALDLPTDRRRPAALSGRGAGLPVSFGAGLTAGLRRLSRGEGATLFMVVLAGFQVLLARYTGQEEVVVGVPAAGRGRPEFEGLIGFFVNTLAVRGRVSGDATFREMVRRTREAVLGGYANAEAPFERVVEEAGGEREGGRSPLFQVMLAWQNAPAGRAEADGLHISPVEIPRETVKYELELGLWEEDGKIVGDIEYSTDLFERGTVERLARHLEALLESAAADPDQPVSKIPLLAEGESRQLLEEWNDTAAAYPHGSCIHQLFESQVERTPEAVAVVCGERRLSYRELNDRANQLAHFLRMHEVTPDSIVALYLEPSLETLVGLLGILKAGGAYLPIDPALPQERLNFLLEDARVRLMLTHRRLGEGLESPRAKMLYLDSGWDLSISRLSRENPRVRVTPDNLAYVIYTSGSTGKPKGVLLQHRGLVNHSTFFARHCGLSVQDRALQFASISFDVATEEIFPALLSGAAVVLWPERRTASFADLQEFIERESLSVLNLPASYWHEWVAELTSAGARLPAALRFVAVGGTQALPKHLAAWQEIAGESVRCCHVYGPTETTITSTFHEFDHGLKGRELDSLPIGRPVANTRAYVLDRHLRPAPVGVAGELYLGGAGLARGYLNRPALTAERFIPDPHGGEPGARLYRTGDLARYLPDGRIDFLGRADHQVKIRGFRIELGEVEAELAQHPDVRECVVVAREEDSGKKYLVAYVVPQPAGVVTAKLRKHLREKLPDYMVPARFVLLDALPLTPSGKVDRAALPAPDLQRSELSNYEAPRTPTQELLAGLWEDLLGVERVGLSDNFFDLGGHSLLVTRLGSRIRHALGVELPLRSVFEAQTLADLAGLIEVALSEGAPAETPPLGRADRTRPLPLSFTQQGLWFLDQLEPGNPFYNCPGAVRLEGKLDVAALERALNEVVRRHEALRTSFASVDGQPAQVIAGEVRLHLQVEDLSALPGGEGAARRLAAEEAARPFDLRVAPLLRARLLRLGAEEHLLLLTTHHIVSDGWSSGVLVRELGALYGAYTQGRPSPLQELPVQYADYAAWQREWLRGEALDAQLSFWREHLRGAPAVLELPTDKPRPEEQTFRGARLPAALSADLSRALRALSRREGVTMFMTLFAGFNVLLHYYTGAEDLVVSTDLANRNRVEVEGLVGFFVNQLPVRVDLSGNPTFGTLLRRVREVTLGAYAHEHVSLDRIVEALKIERSLKYSPLCQVNFTFQNAPLTPVELPGLMISPVETETVTAQLDIILKFGEVEGCLVGAIEYNSDLFEARTAERMVKNYVSILDQVAANPEVSLRSLGELLAEQDGRRRDARAEELKQATRQRLVKRRRRSEFPGAVLGDEGGGLTVEGVPAGAG